MKIKKNKFVKYGLIFIIWLSATAILFSTVWTIKAPDTQNQMMFRETAEDSLNGTYSRTLHLLCRGIYLIASIAIMAFVVWHDKYKKTYDEGYIRRAIKGETHGGLIADVMHGEELKKQKEDEKKYQSQTQTVSDNKAQGIIFGRQKPQSIQVAYCSPAENRHTLAIGITGSGKTSAFLRPTIRSWPKDPDYCLPSEKSGTVFAIDISGDIQSKVQREGAIIFDPMNEDSPVKYDIMAPIYAQPNIGLQIAEIDKVAKALCPIEHNSSGNGSDYFKRNAQNFCKIALYDAFNRHIDAPTAFTEAVSNPDVGDYLTGVLKRDKTGRARIVIGQLASQNEANVSGARDDFKDRVNVLIENPIISKAFRPTKSTTNIDYRTVSKHSLFVKIPQESLKDLYPILSLMCSQLLNNYVPSRSISNSDSVPRLLVALDELSSYYIDGLQNTLATARKYNTSIIACIQSFSQLDSLYGKADRQAIVNNFSYTWFAGTRDPDTADYVSRMVGKERHLQTSTHYGGDDNHFNDSWTLEEIVQSSDLLHMTNTHTAQDKLLLVSPEGYEWLYRNYDFIYNPKSFNNAKSQERKSYEYDETYQRMMEWAKNIGKNKNY